MSEEEPFLPLHVNGEELEGTRHNLSLFTFAGELATHNHVFIILSEEEDQYNGAYVWHDMTAFEDLRDFIATHHFPMHLNLNQVAECDQNARENFLFHDLQSMDSFPEDWDDKA